MTLSPPAVASLAATAMLGLPARRQLSVISTLTLLIRPALCARIPTSSGLPNAL